MKKHDKKVKIKDMMQPIHCVNCDKIGGTLKIQLKATRNNNTDDIFEGMKKGIKIKRIRNMSEKLYMHDQCSKYI